MPIKLMLGARVVESPAEMDALINAGIRLSAVLWTQYMRAYVAEKRHVSDGTRPLGKIPVATGDLEREIIAMIQNVEYVNLGVSFNVGFKSDKYQYVDSGRDPGPISEQGQRELAAWMRVKGIDPKATWAIMTKIKEEGFMGYFFLSPLLRAGLYYMRKALIEGFNQINLDFYLTGTRRETEIIVEG